MTHCCRCTFHIGNKPEVLVAERKIRSYASHCTPTNICGSNEAALQECKAPGLRYFSRIMNAGENPVTWSYEIRDSNNVIAATAKGFDTEKAAMTAGRKKARELKASGSLPGTGVATMRAGQDSEMLVPRK